jgi:hypothetical protein
MYKTLDPFLMHSLLPCFLLACFYFLEILSRLWDNVEEGTSIKCALDHTIPIAPLNEPKDVSLHQNMKEGIIIPTIQVLKPNHV